MGFSGNSTGSISAHHKQGVSVQTNTELKRRLLLQCVLYCFPGEKAVFKRFDSPEVQGPTRYPLRETESFISFLVL